MNIAKLLYHLIPATSRNQINQWRFKALRRAGSIKLLRKLGILTCRNNLQIGIDNAEKNLAKYEKVKFYNLVEENESLTNPVNHLACQELNEVKQLIARNEITILDITDSRFSFRNNHLLDAEMNVLYERHVDFKKLPIYREIVSKRIKKLQGTVAYLSNTQISNYGHWMCLTLPLLRLYDNFFGLEQIDFCYIGSSPLTSWHQESLERAGIAISKIIQEPCTSDRLVAAINNRVTMIGHTPYIEYAAITQDDYLFVRNLFYRKYDIKVKSQKRVYVKRGQVNRRRVLNELAVLETLKRHGFESVEMSNKTLPEEVSIFYQAEAIVAPHGSALVNLLFIQPGVKVLELMPFGYVNSFFYAMASYGAAEYFCLQGENTMQDNVAPQFLDIYIDIQKLEEICEKAFG
jgi:capsular polysaccharide biosynthesis protein